MERRVLIAISLSFLVLFLYQTFLAPPPPEPSAQPPAAAAPAAPGESPTAPAASTPVTDPAPPAVDVVAGDSVERSITVETRTVRAVFTNRGARLQHWVLKNYRSDDGGELDLVPDPSNVNDAYQPFTIRLDDEAVSSRVNGALFTSDAPETVDATAGQASIEFEWQDAEGLRVTKRFTFEP